jgi:hypothetical protein
MPEIEIHIESDSQESLAELRADVVAHVARVAPGATIRLGVVEHTEGAVADFFGNPVWVTLAAPIAAGVVVVALQKVYEALFERDHAGKVGLGVDNISSGIEVKLPKGKVMIVIIDNTDGPRDQGK